MYARPCYTYIASAHEQVRLWMVYLITVSWVTAISTVEPYEFFPY